jgi:hypothetical protein
MTGAGALPLGAEVPAKAFRLAQAARTSADLVMMEVMLFNFMIIDFGLLMFPNTGSFARETPRPVRKTRKHQACQV